MGTDTEFEELAPNLEVGREKYNPNRGRSKMSMKLGAISAGASNIKNKVSNKAEEAKIGEKASAAGKKVKGGAVAAGAWIGGVKSGLFKKKNGSENKDE